MAEKLTPYDSATYLKTDEEIAMYLEACAAEAGDDPAFMAHALGVAARAKNMTTLAADVGMTRQGLYKALSGKGNPSFANVTRIADALGFRMTFALKKSYSRQSPAKGKKGSDQADSVQ